MTPEAQVAAYEDALRTIAAAVVTARARVYGHMQRLPQEAGEELLADCEHALSSLIVLGAVPAPHTALPSPTSWDDYQEHP